MCNSLQMYKQQQGRARFNADVLFGKSNRRVMSASVCEILTLFWSDLLFSANLIDVLRSLELSDRMEGVSVEAGLCTHRKDADGADMAFRIEKKIQLSAPTKQLFPGTHSPNSHWFPAPLRARAVIVAQEQWTLQDWHPNTPDFTSIWFKKI